MDNDNVNPLLWVDETATYQMFGYYASDLSKRSSKKVVAICQTCNKSRVVCKHDLRIRCRVCADKQSAMKRALNNPYRELPSYIDANKTIEVYGYDPHYLAPDSNKMIVTYCSTCKKERRLKMQPAMISPNCNYCSHQTDEIREFRSRNMIGKTPLMLGREHTPETKAKLSSAAKLRIGIKNPRYGKKPSHGIGQWYICNDGTKVWMRSSYEIAFATWLDASEIKWEYEPNAFPVRYILDNILKDGTYRPDFYLPEYNRYIEIKGFWRDSGKAKYDAFCLMYPDKDIDVWFKSELKTIGAIL